MKWKRRPVEDIRTMERLFTVAEAEAARAGDSKPGAEYLVLSALQLPEESARRAFERIGADPDDFRVAAIDGYDDPQGAVSTELVDEHLAPQPAEPVRSSRPVQYGASGRELFQKVVELVRREKTQIYGAYIVLVAAQIDHGTTPQALQRMGLDRHELAAAARAELEDLTT
jgi:hypothetical protein